MIVLPQKKVDSMHFFSSFLNSIISLILYGRDKDLKTKVKSKRNIDNKIIIHSKEELILVFKDKLDKEGIYCDLNMLDVSSIKDMSFLFADSPFRGDISRWDVSGVKDMSYMFRNSSFNGDLSNWDVSNVEKMESMFEGSSFNQPLSKWNITRAVSLDKMFYKSTFNNRIFYVGKSVKFVRYMFAESIFSQNIADWDVSAVTDMTAMFVNSRFNGDIRNWNVENVMYFDNMFADSNFNRDISQWNPISAKSMSFMFTNRTDKEMIRDWNLNKVDCTGMFYSKAMFDDYEKIASAIYNSIPKFENEFPNEFLEFGLPVKMNGKYYIAKICNSLFDEENWYVKFEPVSKDKYELQGEINRIYKE